MIRHVKGHLVKTDRASGDVWTVTVPELDYTFTRTTKRTYTSAVLARGMTEQVRHGVGIWWEQQRLKGDQMRVLGWCGRPDLAEKAAHKAALDYPEVFVVMFA